MKVELLGWAAIDKPLKPGGWVTGTVPLRSDEPDHPYGQYGARLSKDQEGNYELAFWVRDWPKPEEMPEDGTLQLYHSPKMAPPIRMRVSI